MAGNQYLADVRALLRNQVLSDTPVIRLKVHRWWQSRELISESQKQLIPCYPHSVTPMLGSGIFDLP